MTCHHPILCHSCTWRADEYMTVRVSPNLMFNSSSYTIVVNYHYVRCHVPKPITEFIYVPYISDSILDFIKKIESPAVDSINNGTLNGTLVVAKIKKQIEDKLDEDPILRKSRKINILEDLKDVQSKMSKLEQSILPSKEITELQTTTSTLKSDISKLTKLLQSSNELSQQSDLKISQLLQENKQEKEKHDSEMSTMKSSVSQLQEDMKMLFRKTSELHYENTLLKKMLEEKIKTESNGLSFTQANTIGQALMKEDIFNCM